jgi:hypothetical protein
MAMTAHPVAWLLVGLACLGVPLVEDACAVAMLMVATCLWRRALR